MDFWFSYIALASIYVLLGLSTNLLVGIAGIFSVSQAAVFGVGAYIVAFFLMNDITSFLPAMLVASVFCVALNVFCRCRPIRDAERFPADLRRRRNRRPKRDRCR